jgi:hypothetical protein
MAKLTNLKLTPKEAKGDYPECGSIGSMKDKGPRYPYGMELRLDTETLDKLGIDLSDYKVGESCVIEAKATVTRLSESQQQGGKDRRDLELQITDIAIGADKAGKKAKASGNHLNSISGPTSETVEAD